MVVQSKSRLLVETPEACRRCLKAMIVLFKFSSCSKVKPHAYEHLCSHCHVFLGGLFSKMDDSWQLDPRTTLHGAMAISMLTTCSFGGMPPTS